MKYIKNVHGLKLTYHFDKTGWSYQVSGFKDRYERRKALKIYPKHCPPVPKHLVESVIQENIMMLKTIRSINVWGGI